MPNTEANLKAKLPLIKVAVGVVKNTAADILIARRQGGQDLAGLWEFPGGKIEAGESREQALCRELREEVGISVLDSRFLMTINHQYESKQVSLDILLVERFTGKAAGMEGQEVKWVALNQLGRYEFPEANQQIIDYLIQDNT